MPQTKITVNVDGLAEFPVLVTAMFSYDQEETGFVWEPISLIAVELQVGSGLVDLTKSIKKNVLAAGELLHAASNETEQVYEGIRDYIRDKNPMATFANQLLGGLNFGRAAS